MLLGALDSVFLMAYTVALFFTGFIGDQVDIRLFLSFGMLASGLCVMMLGVAHALGIHSLSYFVAFNVLGGCFQAIGWPCVVTVMGRWYGHTGRGMVMGLWSSHTSLGNILGSVLTSFVVSQGMHQHNWPMGFIVPGLLLAGTSVLIWLGLNPNPVVKDSPITFNTSSRNTLHFGDSSSDEEEGGEYVEISDRSVSSSVVSGLG